MRSSCIIADNAAQFSRVNFPDNISLRFINNKTEYSFLTPKESLEHELSAFPKLLPLESNSIIHPPDEQEIEQIIENSISVFDDVYIILHAKEINPIYETFINILNKKKGRATVHLIDSQTISIGQGFLIQSTVDLISRGVNGNMIEKSIRELVPHIYSLFCTPGFSYLHASGFLDIGQSVVGEMLSILPIFSLEDGKFTPIDKLKNLHSVSEYFIEYIEEFDNLLQVSFLQSTPPSIQETKVIKQFIEENYPACTFTEHPHNNYLSSLIGPKGFGIVVIEKS